VLAPLADHLFGAIPWLSCHPGGSAGAAVGFFEVVWHGEGIGDGADLEEALQAYAAVKPEDGDWSLACAAPGAEPCIRRYTSFDAFLDNADAVETIPVTAAMIEAAIA
jgi:hypothetical protein